MLSLARLQFYLNNSLVFMFLGASHSLHDGSVASPQVFDAAFREHPVLSHID